MTMYKKHIALLLLTSAICILSIGFTTIINRSEKVSAVLLTNQTVFNAGDAIVLEFELEKPVTTKLFLHSSYGSTVITPNKQKDTQYSIPNFMTNKSGVIKYILSHKSAIVYEGELQINPNINTKVHLESYIGPPSIIAGGEDYTMQVVIPTDIYDNPLPEETPIQIGHQFLNTEKENILYTKDMMGWKNIFSYDQSGRILLFSVVGETVSKEFSVEVFPALPENFEITSDRRHKYADGNQITELVTSIIKDEYDNVVSDGTIVDFEIIDAKGAVLQTQGSTINGTAVAKILHPDHKDIWRIKAYVYGMAESNTIKLEYTPVLDDFEVVFDKGNREIKVGPLVSFMEQLIPNGALVKLDIFIDDKKIDTKVKTSLDGVVRFILEEGFYVSGEYDIKIKALGIKKEYNNITLQ